MKDKLIILLVLIFACTNWNCFFRSDSEINRETDKAIRQSKALQNLEKICNELPILGRLTPSRKSIGKQGDTLFHYYRLDQDFNELKSVYKENLLRKGWILTKEEPSIWEEQIEFEKEKLHIHISYGTYGNENYGLSCEDKSLAR